MNVRSFLTLALVYPFLSISYAQTTQRPPIGAGTDFACFVALTNGKTAIRLARAPNENAARSMLQSRGLEKIIECAPQQGGRFRTTEAQEAFNKMGL